MIKRLGINFYIFIFILAIMTVLLFMFFPNGKGNVVNKYDNLDNDSIYSFSTVDQFFSKIDSKHNFHALICVHQEDTCQNNIKTLEEQLKNTTDKIYYIEYEDLNADEILKFNNKYGILLEKNFNYFQFENDNIINQLISNEINLEIEIEKL